MERKQSCDGSQTTFLPLLAAAESDRRALIRGALARLGFRSDLANGLESLLMLLDVSAGEQGCRAYIRTLCERLNAGRRTIDRRLRVLRDHRLIRSVRSRPGGPCYNRLDWGRLRNLAFGDDDRDEPTAGRDASASPAIPTASVVVPTVAASASDGGRRFGVGPAPFSVAQSGATSRQSGATSRQSGAIILTDLTSVAPPPPTPPETSVEVCGAERAGWCDAEAVVAAAGVASWREAVEAARTNGLVPSDVRAIVADWRRRLPRERWDNAAGMLVYLLRTARPDAIPRPAETPQARAPTPARPSEQTPDATSSAAFEALDAEQRDDLARRALGPVLLRMYRADRQSPLARMMMIGFLREQSLNTGGNS